MTVKGAKFPNTVTDEDIRAECPFFSRPDRKKGQCLNSILPFQTGQFIGYDWDTPNANKELLSRKGQKIFIRGGIFQVNFL